MSRLENNLNLVQDGVYNWNNSNLMLPQETSIKAMPMDQFDRMLFLLFFRIFLKK